MSDKNLCLWHSHKVKMLIPNFKNNNDVTMALVKTVGRIKLLDTSVPRIISRGSAFIVPLHTLDVIEDLPMHKALLDFLSVNAHSLKRKKGDF